MSLPHNELGNEKWTVLEDEYKRCVGLILSLNAKNVIEQVKNPNTLSRVQDRDALIKNIKVLKSDLDVFVNRLNEIHEKHKGWKGTTNGPNELITLYGIWEEYANWTLTFNNVVIPNIHTILNQIHYDLSKEEIPFDSIQLDSQVINNE